MHFKGLVCLLATTLVALALMVPTAEAKIYPNFTDASGGEIPANTFVGGVSRTDLPIYVCRVVEPGEYKIVGRMVSQNGGPSEGCVYVKEGGILIESGEYQVLDANSAFTWEAWNGTVPENALTSGFGVGSNKKTHYMCQLPSPEDPSALIPGKLKDRTKTCQIVYGKGAQGVRTIHTASSGFKILVEN